MGRVPRPGSTVPWSVDTLERDAYPGAHEPSIMVR
jgi:hypothetical protein